jgi:small-conductance mechanosensitive channel
VVEDIGIRASVVHTWQGADVIVPNAALISDNLINWTLTNMNRRMEIPVGVAYGSSPEQVIELMLGIARGHPEVLDEPEPAAIFTGFGDSSLNFELRAWTAGDFVAVASDLRIAINRALADAGIAIPFPQRDLHLRSVDHQVAESLAGNGARKPIEVEPDASSGDSEAPTDPANSQDVTG